LSRYGTTAVESRARHSRGETRFSSERTASPGKVMSVPGAPMSFCLISTSQLPSGSGVEKWIPPTAAGSVALVLTTSRSPGRSRAGSSAKT